jgi:hypothetical protein
MSPFLCNGIHGFAQLVGDAPQDATELFLILVIHDFSVI